jgi:hypothetical protein
MKNTKRPRLFNRLFALLPKRILNRIVSEYQGDRYRKRHSIEEFLRLCCLSLISGASSLRETINLIHADKRWGHLVNPNAPPVSRAQAYKINNALPPEMFARIFQCFSAWLRFHNGSKQKKVYAIDSTFIESRSRRCRIVKRGFKGRKLNKSTGIKAHLVMDISNRLPARVAVTEGNIHDVNLLHLLDALGKTTIRVFDKGYRHYDTLMKYIDENKWFITPRITAGNPVIIAERKTTDQDRKAGVCADLICQLGVCWGREKYQVRCVTVQPDDRKDSPYILMTNLFDVTAAEVASIYRQRSKIEVDIHHLKQLFRTRKLSGYTDNAVKNQWLIALITYMLVWLFERTLMPGTGIWHTANFIKYNLNTTWNQIVLPETG